MRELYRVYRTSGFVDTSESAFSEGYGQYADWFPSARDARMLDIGCGGGEFLAFLGKRGYTHAEGIDLSEEQIERCRERGLERVAHVDDAETFLAAHVSAFDCVVMNDVLEHVPKARCIPLLLAIRASLRPGGSVVIKVPNLSSVYGPVARYLDFTHELGFTEHSIQQVLTAAGYSAVELRSSRVVLTPRPKRIAYYAANALYRFAHRLVYLAAVGEDAPRLLGKLLFARASAER